MVTFLLGLLVAGGGSVWVSGMLLKKDIDKASKEFVKQSAMNEAINSWSDFENGTNAQVQALETQVKGLSEQLTAMKAANDSLQAVALASAEAAKKATSSSRKKITRRGR
jgi:hypothetical protein